jgi:Ca2+-binding EF-hand superfamily protein
MFNEIDTNKDGLISQEELSHSMEGVKSSQLLRNHKKKSISFIEFKELMLGIFEEMSDQKK